MSSNVTQTPPNRPLPGSWQANDAGPSMMRTDDPTLARVLGGMGGALLVIIGGLPLAKYYPELENASLWCCTELTRRTAIDAAAKAVAQ